MGWLDLLFDVLFGLVHLACLGCFVWVVIRMFQTGNVVLGVVSIATCCVGYWVAFVWGWVKSADDQLNLVMTLWTALSFLAIALTILRPPAWDLPAFGTIR